MVTILSRPQFVYKWFVFCICWRHDDVITWKHFPRYWPFVWGIHRSPVNSPHKGQWRGALIFFLICAWTNGWVHNRDAGDLRRHCCHYDVTVMRFVRDVMVIHDRHCMMLLRQEVISTGTTQELLYQWRHGVSYGVSPLKRFFVQQVE